MSFIKRFDGIDGFDRDKYMYLKSRIESDRNEKRHYDLLREFYHSHIIKNKIEINRAGLIDEYIKFNDEIIQRFCKRRKLLMKEKEALQIINGMLYILKGEVFKSIEIYKDLNFFNEDNFDLMLLYNNQFNLFHHSVKVEVVDTVDLVSSGFSRTEDIVRSKNTSQNIILTNLYLLFFHLNFQTGIQYFESVVETRYKGLSYNDFNLRMLYLWRTHTLKYIQSFFDEVKSEYHKRIYIPLEYTLHKRGSNVDITFDFNEETSPEFQV